MTGYSYEGNLIDVKGFNFHDSAKPDTTLNVAGASAFGTLPFVCIPAGAILTEGAVAGTVDISVGAADENMIGVATTTRMAADARGITYTVLGRVKLIAGTGGVTKGDFVKSDNQAGYYGCAITWADQVDTVAHSLTAKKSCIGKALTTAAVGEFFEAYVNFMN